MPDNRAYIIAAYTVTWIVLVGYTLRLIRVARRAREQFRAASRTAGGERS